MNKKSEYIRNTAILLLGKFTTQFMSFLLIPLYTNKLTADDYGTIDLLQTYITLLVPVLSLRLDSATFRFLIDNRKSEEGIKKTVSNILIVILASLSFLVIVATIIPLFVIIPSYFATIANIAVLIISGVLLQILRGLGDNKGYSIASILTGLTTLLLNMLLILGFNRGAESILISATAANIICCIYVFISAKLYRRFSIKLFNKNAVKKYLSYSLPMIPNALSWWVVNVSDRTIIRVFLGAAFNGIYTVSCKFSNLLNSVFTIFNMSWQESASLHINDEDRDEYFSKMINQIFMFFSSVALLILAALPIIYTIVVGEEYWDSYQYIPVLLYANSWNVLVNLIGGIYVAKKRTKEIAHTTIASAIINIIINLALIKFIGLHAATISTLISYMAMAIYRAIDCQKYVKLKIKVKDIILFTIIFTISSTLYILNNPIINIINLISICIYVFIINVNNLKAIKATLSRKIRRE